MQELPVHLLMEILVLQLRAHLEISLDPSFRPGAKLQVEGVRIALDVVISVFRLVYKHEVLLELLHCLLFNFLDLANHRREHLSLSTETFIEGNRVRVVYQHFSFDCPFLQLYLTRLEQPVEVVKVFDEFV